MAQSRLTILDAGCHLIHVSFCTTQRFLCAIEEPGDQIERIPNNFLMWPAIVVELAGINRGTFLAGELL
jgi:hypothetical protein